MSKVNLGRVKGDPGTAATIKIGTTTTLEPGSQATVNNSGNENAAVFNFGIPKGEEGKAASIMIDSVQTLQPEENATVENVGTTSDARLKFGIPRGADEQGTEVPEPEPEPEEEYPAWKQPTGAHDAYYKDDKMTFTDGNKYICIAPEGVACVWSPVEYPTYWQLVA